MNYVSQFFCFFGQFLHEVRRWIRLLGSESYAKVDFFFFLVLLMSTLFSGGKKWLGWSICFYEYSSYWKVLATFFLLTSFYP